MSNNRKPSITHRNGYPYSISTTLALLLLGDAHSTNILLAVCTEVTVAKAKIDSTCGKQDITLDAIYVSLQYYLVI